MLRRSERQVVISVWQASALYSVGTLGRAQWSPGVRAGGLGAVIILRVMHILKPVSCFFLEFSIYCFQIIVAERKNTIKKKKMARSLA